MDTANGPGLRVSLFVSGCPHKCPGCFNAVAWDFKYGQLFTQEVIDEILTELKFEHITGLTLLGGEPLAPENQEEVWSLISQVRSCCPQKSIWCYSGYTFEYIQNEMFLKLPYIKNICKNIDVLVDGRFEQDLLDLKLKFRGSRNQRVIDVQETLSQNKIIWSNEVDDKEKYVLTR